MKLLYILFILALNLRSINCQSIVIDSAFGTHGVVTLSENSRKDHRYGIIINSNRLIVNFGNKIAILDKQGNLENLVDQANPIEISVNRNFTITGGEFLSNTEKYFIGIFDQNSQFYNYSLQYYDLNNFNDSSIWNKRSNVLGRCFNPMAAYSNFDNTNFARVFTVDFGDPNNYFYFNNYSFNLNGHIDSIVHEVKIHCINSLDIITNLSNVISAKNKYYLGLTRSNCDNTKSYSLVSLDQDFVIDTFDSILDIEVEATASKNIALANLVEDVKGNIYILFTNFDDNSTIITKILENKEIDKSFGNKGWLSIPEFLIANNSLIPFLNAESNSLMLFLTNTNTNKSHLFKIDEQGKIKTLVIEDRYIVNFKQDTDSNYYGLFLSSDVFNRSLKLIKYKDLKSVTQTETLNNGDIIFTQFYNEIHIASPRLDIKSYELYDLTGRVLEKSICMKNRLILKSAHKELRILKIYFKGTNRFYFFKILI